jgi:hypothetical protein
MFPFQKSSGEPVCRNTLRATGSETQFSFLPLAETIVRFALTSESRLAKRRQRVLVEVEYAAPLKQTLFRKDATQCTFHRLYANSILSQPDPRGNALVFRKTKGSPWPLAEFLHKIFADFSVGRNEEIVTNSASRTPLRNPVFATLTSSLGLTSTRSNSRASRSCVLGDSHAT